MLQHTPRAITEALPSLVTFPPQLAEDAVILLTVEVVTVGVIAETVVKVI